jgi:AcrR family transcriptional regulator
MTPAAPVRTRDGAATRARIEKEALRLFAEKGVEGATIRDLSQAVGVADAALYRYFGSKEAIAAELFTRHYGALAKRVAEIGAREQPFGDCVAALVDLLCSLFDEAPDVFAFILLNQHAHLRFVQKDANVVEELRAIMARAMTRGDIPDGDPDLAAAMALGAVLQPAVFKLYGRLGGSLRDRGPLLARAALQAAGAR